MTVLDDAEGAIFRPHTVLGLMSGTSLDGIDAALLVTDGERVTSFGAASTTPYPAAFRRRLRALLGRRPDDSTDDSASDVMRELTLLHAEAVMRLLAAAGIGPSAVDVIGFHGHTVFHQPEAGTTVQIGDGRLLADRTGIPVVEDFRSADVAAGGQGAPMVPLFHAALADPLAKPLAVLNIGGVANVTWIGERSDGGDDAVVAFDTGPGNALIDDWVRATSGGQMDTDGRLAGAGRADEALVAGWLGHDFFHRPPPKSLDRDAYAGVLADLRGFSAADGAATLSAFTARAVGASRAFMAASPRRWLVTGGGRYNRVLLAMIEKAVGAPVEPVERVGWNGDALEAQAFAFLAVRSLRGLPLSLPTTTGVPRPQAGGTLRRPRMPAEDRRGVAR